MNAIEAGIQQTISQQRLMAQQADELRRDLREKNAELDAGHKRWKRSVLGLDFGRAFWRPIVARWLVWFGCSWAVGSVIWLLPALVKLIKGAQ